MMDYRHYSYPGNLLEGRIILITGASDGIGRALAVHAAGHGARVILHGRNASKLEKVYDEIEALQGAPRPSIAVMDLGAAGSDAYTSLADSLADEFGRLDGLVNNAGILGERYSIEQYDAAMWQQVMHVNVTAAFAITQVCLPLLRQSVRGLEIRYRGAVTGTGERTGAHCNSGQLYQPRARAHRNAAGGLSGRRSG
jgi:NAD(P)-dependent dehydrogenase (short-subunit alcohol dehydrogenase family)